MSTLKSTLRSPPPAPKLLERDRELAELDALLRGARAGSGATVLIEAAAGIGKTRLLRRLRDRAARQGVRVLWARGAELERELPYGVVRQLLEPPLAGIAESERAALLQGPAAAARPVVGAGPAARSSPEEPFATLYGLYWLTAGLSQQGPLLLAVDDAHWADEQSLRFLRFVTGRLDGLPVLVAVASRRAEPGGLLASLGGDPSTTRVTPEPLGPRAVGELLADVLGRPPDESFASACHALTGGNPFLLTELAHTLAAEHVQPDAASAATLRDRMPETIVRAVLLRLSPLPAHAREVARSVAILGDGCEQRHVALLTGLDRHAVGEAADLLRDAEVLDPEPPLAFLHPLIRDAVYADLSPGARTREHERSAEMLAADGAPVERVAAQLLAAEPGGRPQAVETLMKAARAALERGAPRSAVAYVHRALREPPAAPARADLLELLALAAVRAADPPALAAFEADVVEVVMADRERLMRSAEHVAPLLIGAGKLDEGMRILERAIAAAEESGDLDRAVMLDAVLISFRQLPPREVHARLARYEGRLAEGSTELRRVQSLRSWWTTLTGGPAAQATALARSAVGESGAFELTSSPLSWGPAVFTLIRGEDLDAAERAADGVIAAANARGSASTLSGGWYLRGLVALHRGELQRAETDARQAVEVTRWSDFTSLVYLYTGLLVETLIDRDELDAAERELELSSTTGDLPDWPWVWQLLESRGRLRLAQGRARESVDELLRLLDLMSSDGMAAHRAIPVGAYAARALAALGDQAQAVAMAEEQLAESRLWGAPSTVAEAMAALGAVAGGDRGLALLGEAATLLERSPRRLLRAATLLDLGTLLRRERRPGEAREPLREALDLARRCGGVAVAGRAARELEATGEKVARYTPIGAESLTSSERRVAEMAARGMTNREIAASLYVTIKTVESHLRAAFDKLGVRSRKDLAGALGAAT